MFHDTSDSSLRLAAVNLLDRLNVFGTPVSFIPAAARRSAAASDLGALGPAGKAAIPDLMAAAQGSDEAVREAAIMSLGTVHVEQDVVVPFLIKYLDDSQFKYNAATALGCFGKQAEPAVPKLIPLLHTNYTNGRIAAATALRRIDPDAYASAMTTPVR